MQLPRAPSVSQGDTQLWIVPRLEEGYSWRQKSPFAVLKVGLFPNSPPSTSHCSENSSYHGGKGIPVYF